MPTVASTPISVSISSTSLATAESVPSYEPLGVALRCRAAMRPSPVNAMPSILVPPISIPIRAVLQYGFASWFVRLDMRETIDFDMVSNFRIFTLANLPHGALPIGREIIPKYRKYWPIGRSGIH